MMTVGAVSQADFHSRGASAVKALSPVVDRRMHGTTITLLQLVP